MLPILELREVSRRFGEHHFKKYQKWLKGLFKPEDDSIMRQYIRHPSNIPLHFQIEEGSMPVNNRIKDVSVGGLCFATDKPMSPGTKIHIHIPLAFGEDGAEEPEKLDVKTAQMLEEDEGFDADGYVAWCRMENDKYAVGVQFDDQSTQFGVRMVEQVCHIEQYRYGVLEGEGRSLGKEEAAKEWVERFAADFPH